MLNAYKADEIPKNDIRSKIIRELGEDFVKIAQCESGMKQFKDGKVLISRTNDKGLFQINKVHWKNAEKLGYNLDTIDGNIAYAKYLKEKNGKGDWYMSKGCWNK